MFKSSPCIYQMFIFWLRHLYLEIVLVFQVKGRCNYLRTEHVGGRLCFSYWIPKVPQASSYYLKHIRVAFTFAILLLFSSRWLAIFKALISSKNIIQSSLWGKKNKQSRERRDVMCHSADDSTNMLHDRKRDKVMWPRGEEFLPKSEGET